MVGLSEICQGLTSERSSDIVMDSLGGAWIYSVENTKNLWPKSW